jgi:hypothetical protein
MTDAVSFAYVDRQLASCVWYATLLPAGEKVVQKNNKQHV